MAKHFILTHWVEPDELFIKQYEAPNPYGEDYAEGIAIPNAGPIRLHYRGGRKTDLLSGIFSFPVVSKRLRALIQELEPDNTEFLETVELIDDDTGSVDRDYAFMNLLNHPPCLDRERSELRTIPQAPGVVLGIEKLVLLDAVIEDRHVFRVEELATWIVVSQEFRARVEARGLSGMRFMELSDFRK